MSVHTGSDETLQQVESSQNTVGQRARVSEDGIKD